MRPQKVLSSGKKINVFLDQGVNYPQTPNLTIPITANGVPLEISAVDIDDNGRAVLLKRQSKL